MATKILAISGSLRKLSTNSRLLSEVVKYSTHELIVRLFDQVEELPQYNPDKESSPNSVTKLWLKQMKEADAFIVSTPEYAHGIPGALKNALDWLVSTDSFIDKPYTLYRVCPRPVYCPESLLEVLNTMSGRHIKEADIAIDFKRNIEIAEEELAKDTNKKKIMDSLEILKQLAKQSQHKD